MECSFCGRDIERGTETIFVTKKGKVFYFCSSKCEKNLLKLGRKPRKIKWTEAYRAEKATRLGMAAKEAKEEERKRKKEEEEKKEEERKRKKRRGTSKEVTKEAKKESKKKKETKKKKK
ncbi:MAG: hypothetical protein DRO89_01260 [Candidatus Altiarchaeales archaeon]|nr:MAG: hypothetical protein DRO89_01260 [Candidatus Altiarchaeales archaeon]